MLELNTIRIIYSDGPGTSVLAEHLRDRLARYRVPRDVRRRTGLERVTQLTEPWLIVLCTPETPQDREILTAIDEFTAAGLYHHILTMVISGKSGSVFPDNLRFERRPDGSVIEHEPLAANISAPSERQRRRLLETEKLRLLAPMLGVTFDDLMNRRRKARARVLSGIAAAFLAGSAAFLGYALNRSFLITEQNRQLQVQYDQAREASDRARIQRDMAEKSFVKTLAVRAGNVLEEGNSELALKLCMEYLPEHEDLPELAETLKDALRELCAGGYVPVTDRKKYMQTRGLTEEDGTAAEEDSTEDVLPAHIYVPVPEDIESELPVQKFGICCSVPEFGYGLYKAGILQPGGNRNLSSSSTWCTVVHFPDTPERDYYLRTEDGKPYYVRLAHVLYDGTFICQEGGGRPMRVDPFSGRFIPFFDPEADTAGGNADLSAAAAPSSGRHPADVEFKYFRVFDGADVILGVTGSFIEVWSGEPFRYLETLEGVTDFKVRGDGNVLIGEKRKALAVCSKRPFCHLYDISDEYTANHKFDYGSFNTASAPGGRGYLALKSVVYDLNTGKFLRDFGNLNGGAVPEFSGEGLALISGVNMLRLWDLEKDEEFAKLEVRIPADAPDQYPKITYELLGPVNEETGRRTASVIAANGMVYEYRQARDVPEDLAGQMALARELLGDGWELTEKEQMTYLLK